MGGLVRGATGGDGGSLAGVGQFVGGFGWAIRAGDWGMQGVGGGGLGFSSVRKWKLVLCPGFALCGTCDCRGVGVDNWTTPFRIRHRSGSCVGWPLSCGSRVLWGIKCPPHSPRPETQLTGWIPAGLIAQLHSPGLPINKGLIAITTFEGFEKFVRRFHVPRKSASKG